MSPLDLSAELPPERDDEPSSLRQDIFDELTDHLECSLHREQVKTGDEELARRNVIQKFGNPASIARKLWLDAMWEKIVMQRLSFFMTGLMTAACIAMAVMLWRSIEKNENLIASQQRALTEQQTAWQSRMDEMAASQRELVEKLQSQTPAAVNPEPSVWVNVEYRFAKGTRTGPPAVGVRMSLVAASSNPTLGSFSAVSDAEGVARFPKVHHGIYDWTMTLPETSSQGTHESRKGSILIEAGKEFPQQLIVCPAGVHQPVAVIPRLELPEDLREVPVNLLLGPGPDLIKPSIAYREFFSQRLADYFEWRDEKLTKAMIPAIVGFNNRPFEQALISPTGAVIPANFRGSPNGNSPRGVPTLLSGTLVLEEKAPSLMWPDREYRPDQFTMVIFSFAPDIVTQRVRAINPEFFASNLITTLTSGVYGAGVPEIVDYLKTVDAAILPVERLGTVPQIRPRGARRGARNSEVDSQPQPTVTNAQSAYQVTMTPNDYEVRFEETTPISMWIKPSPDMIERLRSQIQTIRDDFAFIKNQAAAIENAYEQSNGGVRHQ